MQYSFIIPVIDVRAKLQAQTQSKSDKTEPVLEEF